MTRSAILLLLLLTVAGASARAAEPSARDQLQHTQKELEQSKAREQEIVSQSERVEGELQSLQGGLVHLGDTIQRNERGLLDAEDKLRILTRELKEKQDVFAGRKRELNTMVQAAIRLSQTPPEAALVMPGDFNDTLKTSRVLSMLAGSIRRESDSLSKQMEELKSLQGRVKQSEERISADQATLKNQQQMLDGKLSERKRLAEHLLKEQENARKRVAELSRQAKDLKDLLGALEKDRAAEAVKRADEAKTSPRRKQKPTASGRMRSFAGAKGSMTSPVAGRIRHIFGEMLARNETSKGVTIGARGGARVLAPYDSEVVFTGPFLNYGNMVILRHSDDFHTLLAGFSEVQVSVGEFLLEGEPIGAMGKAPSEADLYVELRQSNQPVDPAPWIPGLNKTN